MSNTHQDLSNGRFGSLTASAYIGNRFTGSGKEEPHWNCYCSCGNNAVVSETNLITGNSKSCGCASHLDSIHH